MMNSETGVRIRDLHVTRGKTVVLKGLNFELPTGCIIGLLGPSGSGKSTLLRCIVGNQIIQSGTVTVLGLPAGSKALRHQIGYMTQSDGVYDDLSVRQNIAYFAKILGAPSSDVQRVIDLTDLTSHAKALVMNLSGGQRNRVSLAIALLGTPSLLVLDEPTVGLDPVLRAELWTLFAQLAEQGMTLLISSHVMDEAMRCDDLLLLRDGEVLAQLTPEELLKQTGEQQPEDAFLALIKASSSSTEKAVPRRARHREED